MEVQGLRLLREIARSGSISAAADALGYTQSAASRQLATLERSAGHPLAERTARGACLTPAGEILLGRADVVLAELDGAREELERLVPDARADVRVAAFHSAVGSFLPHAVAAAAPAGSGVRIRVALTAGQTTEETVVRDGRADVCVASGPVGVAFSPDMRVVPLRDDPLWCCLPAGHARAGDRRVAIADLRDEPWVMTAMTLCADRALVMDACARNGFRPRAAAACDDYGTTQGLVAAGTGVAMLPQMVLARPHPGIVVRPPTVPVLRRVVALLPRRAPVRPEVEAFLDALRAAAADLPAPEGHADARPPSRPGADADQASGTPVRSSQADSGSPVIRSYASA